MFKRSSPLEQEWKKLEKAEITYLEKELNKTDSKLNQFLEDKVPANLQETLDNAFFKAFNLVFDKGTSLIEKTYNKKDLQTEYQINEFTSQIKGTRKSLKKFSKKAAGSSKFNTLLSGVSGVGLGVLGIGLPDIALFTSLMLKNLYEISLHYGFDYESEEEKRFILLLIEAALSHGYELQKLNKDINQFIDTGIFSENGSLEYRISQSAKCLSKELLYMKFIQGIPIVGMIGGAYDYVYMKKISKYAQLKYKRRFYQKQRKP